MIRRIFLDLDDVCNTLTMYLLHCRGVVTSPTDYSQYPAQYGWDIVGAANHLAPEGVCQVTVSDFWNAVTRKQWVSAPESEIFPWILEICDSLVERKNICIASSPTKDPDSLAGKLEWIHAHFPDWLHRQYAITPCKHLFARYDDLLIDDSQANVDTFERNGGQGILVPRPWNSAWGEDSKSYILERIDSLR